MVKKWKQLLPVQTLSGKLDRTPDFYWVQQLTQTVRAFFGRGTRYWWEDLPTIDPESLLSGSSQPPSHRV